MDTSEIPKVEPVEVVSKKQPSKKNILYVLVAVLLVAGLAVIGWLYYSSTQKVGEQSTLITNLQDQLRNLGVDVSEAGVVADTESVNCNGGSAYSAEIGKFAITVDSPRVIVRSLDANFEGGPITDLTIGKCVPDEMNVVDTYILSTVDITGHPAADSATLKANYEAQSGMPLTPGAPVTIDGVAAQTYTSDGLFLSKLIYFDNAGIGYQIKLTSANEGSEATLTDVISDWSFTP